MKITIAQGAFLPVPPLGGGAVEKIWHALGREFAARGHEVTHVSRAFGNLPAAETDDAGVRHRRVRGHETPRSLAWLKVLDLLYSRRVRRGLPPADVLVTHTFWLPMLCRDRSRVALYVHVQRYPRGQMRFYGHAARLQTVSSVIAEAIVAQTPAVAPRVVVIPNPILGPANALDEAALGALRDAREPAVLYAGRIHPEKGLGLLLDAFARFLRDPGSDGWRLRLVGPWETALGGGGEAYRDELERRAARLGLPPGAVEWAGFIGDPARLRREFERAAVFVYPSLAGMGEASPLAPLEAMAAGCPTVVSRLECFAGYLRDGDTGLAFDHEADDPPGALAALLARLAASPGERAALGRAGWRRSLDFALPRVADLYLEDFQAAAEGRPPSPR